MQKSLNFEQFYVSLHTEMHSRQTDASLLQTIMASSSKIQEKPITSKPFCLFLSATIA